MLQPGINKKQQEVVKETVVSGIVPTTFLKWSTSCTYFLLQLAFVKLFTIVLVFSQLDTGTAKRQAG